MILFQLIFKTIIGILGLFLLFVAGYFICAFALSRLTIDKVLDGDQSVTIYILTNGVHSDLLLPVKTTKIDWSEVFPYANTIGNDTSQPYIGIGWGDKGFYLNTPTWDDLTFPTAFNAVFGLSTTAVHATYHHAISDEEKHITLQLSAQQYAALVDYITKSLQLDANGKPILIITDANYGNSDAFYEAHGKYSMFITCNTWTNNALKVAGQKACWWTPFQSGIFQLYGLE